MQAHIRAYLLHLTATTGDYTGISFIYGFNEADNASGAYPDLECCNLELAGYAGWWLSFYADGRYFYR